MVYAVGAVQLFSVSDCLSVERMGAWLSRLIDFPSVYESFVV